MKQMPWKIRKRALESPGFSINFFCGNPVLADIDIYVNILAFAIFCPWGMKMTIKKKLTAAVPPVLNIVLPVVQDYLALTEKNFGKDGTIIDTIIVVWEGSLIITEHIVTIASKIWFRNY